MLFVNKKHNVTLKILHVVFSLLFHYLRFVLKYLALCKYFCQFKLPHESIILPTDGNSYRLVFHYHFHANSDGEKYIRFKHWNRTSIGQNNNNEHSQSQKLSTLQANRILYIFCRTNHHWIGRLFATKTCKQMLNALISLYLYNTWKNRTWYLSD